MYVNLQDSPGLLDWRGQTCLSYSLHYTTLTLIAQVLAPFLETSATLPEGSPVTAIYHLSHYQAPDGTQAMSSYNQVHVFEIDL